MNFNHEGALTLCKHGSKECPVCKESTNPLNRYKIKYDENIIETFIRDPSQNVKQKTFNWLCEHLLAPSDKFKGCEMIFPDTVLFKSGKAHLLIRCDKDYCLTSLKGSKK
jgi:hypothetical protein